MATYAGLAYRRAASHQLSAVGMVIALYDTLMGDLQRAAEAMRAANIEERSRQLKHGFAVLTQLDTLLDTENGGDSAHKLRRFYGYIRNQMLQAQFKQDATLLDRSAEYVLNVRGAWQQVELRPVNEPTAETVAAPASNPSRKFSAYETNEENAPMSFLA